MNSKRRAGAVLFLMALMGVPEAQAGIENRPVSTDDAFTLEKGFVLLALGSAYTQAHNKDKQTTIAADAGVGVTDTLEISADFPYVLLDPKSEPSVDAFGDIAIRPEWAFFKEGSYQPAVSLAGTIKLDNGNDDKGLGTGAVDEGISLQVTKSFEPITLHLNGGYTFVGEPTGTKMDDVISYNVAGEVPLADHWAMWVELYGQTNSDPTATDDPLEWLMGFIYTPRKGLALDFGVGTGFTDASPDVRVTAGVTVTLEGWGR